MDMHFQGRDDVRSFDYFVEYIDNADSNGNVCAGEKQWGSMDIDFILNIINKMGSGETHKSWLYRFCLIS